MTDNQSLHLGFISNLGRLAGGRVEGLFRTCGVTFSESRLVV